jgi:hypothetical protein
MNQRRWPVLSGLEHASARHGAMKVEVLVYFFFLLKPLQFAGGGTSVAWISVVAF